MWASDLCTKHIQAALAALGYTQSKPEIKP